MKPRYHYLGTVKCRTCDHEEVRGYWLDADAHPMDCTEMRCTRCRHYTAEFVQTEDDGGGSAGVLLAS